MAEQKLTWAELHKTVDIVQNIVTEFRRDEPANLAILGKDGAVVFGDVLVKSAQHSVVQLMK